MPAYQVVFQEQSFSRAALLNRADEEIAQVCGRDDDSGPGVLRLAQNHVDLDADRVFGRRHGLLRRRHRDAVRPKILLGVRIVNMAPEEAGSLVRLGKNNKPFKQLLSN